MPRFGKANKELQRAVVPDRWKIEVELLGVLEKLDGFFAGEPRLHIGVLDATYDIGQCIPTLRRECRVNESHAAWMSQLGG